MTLAAKDNPLIRKHVTTELLDIEKFVLTLLMYHGSMYYDDSYYSEQKALAAQSLCRFGYVSFGQIERKMKLYVAPIKVGGWLLTDEGIEQWEALDRPMHYRCCQYAIRYFCVCRERTGCPNPDHDNHGCHGSHD